MILSDTTVDLFLRVFIFDILAAFFIAKLEIEIEGKYGWAENLPTWRVKNNFTKLLFGDHEYTGYHFWLALSVVLFLHLVFFAFPWMWSLSREVFLLGNFLLAVLFEDFLWFVLNPHFGLRKFNKVDAHWHNEWVGSIPLLYLKLGITAILLLLLSLI